MTNIWYYSKGGDEVNKKLHHFIFVFRQVKPLKRQFKENSHDFDHSFDVIPQTCLIFTQISLPGVDYVWFLLECIPYHNIKKLYNM